MKDIVYPPCGPPAERMAYVGAGDRAGERDLRLAAGDAVDRQLMCALEIAHQAGELRVEHIARRRRWAHLRQVLQTLPQPAHSAPRMPAESGFTGELGRAPQHHEVAQPVVRELAESHRLRAAELEARLLVVEAGEHHLVARRRRRR